MSSSMKARLLFWSGIAGWRFLSLFLQWARNLSRAPRLRGAQRSPGRPPGGAGPEVRRQSSRRLPPIWRRCEGYSCGAAHSTRGPRNPPEKRVGTFLEAHRCQCWKQPQIRLPPEQGRCRPREHRYQQRRPGGPGEVRRPSRLPRSGIRHWTPTIGNTRPLKAFRGSVMPAALRRARLILGIIND